MNCELGQDYTSGCQIARVVTEEWAHEALFCVACSSNRLDRAPHNTRAYDLACPKCDECYQLKSRRTWSERKVADAGYHAMMTAIAADKTPNLLILQYSGEWRVKNLLLIPRFFFTASAIEKRKPLGPNAPRAGWVGCNIRLDAIAPDGKLRIVSDGCPTPAPQVRQWYRQVLALSTITPIARGWSLEVLSALRSMRRADFTLSDAYALEAQLSRLYPENRNVRPKIRQQLQVLRDKGIVTFLGNGRYRLAPEPS